MDLCRRCPDGTYARPGASECTACPAGTFRNSFEDLDNNGYTKDAAGVSLCYQCPVGYYTPRVGMARCLPCAAGYVAKALRSTDCTACPKGKFSMERIGANADADLLAMSDVAIAGDDFDSSVNTPWLDTQMSAQASCSLVPQGAVRNACTCAPAPCLCVSGCTVAVKHTDVPCHHYIRSLP